MEKEKESFVFYRSFKVALSELNDDDKLIMYEAISDYALDRNEPKLEGFPKALFSLIKPQLDANWKRYEAGVENGHKGKEYGKLGGRPKKAKTLKKPSNNPQETLTEPANVNENVNVNVNDLDKLALKKNEFEKSIEPFVSKYGEDMCNDFYSYWTEPNKSQTKLRFELEKTWDVSRRLARWFKNEKDFKKGQNEKSNVYEP